MKTILLSAFVGTASAVTCEILQDNEIKSVFVDGVDITWSGPDNHMHRRWNKASTFEFSDDAKVLAMRTADYENGCTTGGLFMKCTSSNPKWNIDSENPYAFKVASTNDWNWSPHPNWMNKNYGTGNKNLWKTPLFSQHTGLTAWNEVGVNYGLCGGDGKITFFRYDTRVEYPTEMTTCEINMDDAINNVYVDGVEINTMDRWQLSQWNNAATFVFPATAQTLAIKGQDNQNGCTGGGLFMQCRSSNPKWKISTKNPYLFKVASVNNWHEEPHKSWYKKHYNPANKNLWKIPNFSHVVKDGLCGETKYMYFRYDAAEEHVTEFTRCEINMDDIIENVYVDGQAIDTIDHAQTRRWNQAATFVFPASAETMAIKAIDTNYGDCSNGGLFLKCESTNPLWQITSENPYAFKVAASNDPNAEPHNNWYKKEYTAGNTNIWDTPRFSQHKGLTLHNDVNVKYGLCGAAPYTYFRFDTRVKYETELTHCEILMDNEIRSVYVDGKEVFTMDKEELTSWDKAATFYFPSSAEVLALNVQDHERGCASGGMFMKCTSETNPNWNIDSVNPYEWTVASTPNRDNSVPHAAWYKKNYNGGAQKWKTPRYSLHHDLTRENEVGVEYGLCANTATDLNMFFRHDTRISYPKTEDLVFCDVMMDNIVHGVYVDGVEIFAEGPVENDKLNNWNQASQFSFPKTAQLLAIKSQDYERGCTSGGLYLQCETSDPKSKWNMNSEEVQKFLVQSSQTSAPQHLNWYKSSFQAQGKKGWTIPAVTRHGGLKNRIKGVTTGLCGTANGGTDQFMFFRYQVYEKCNAMYCQDWHCNDWCECFDEEVEASSGYDQNGCMPDGEQTCECPSEV